MNTWKEKVNMYIQGKTAHQTIFWREKKKESLNDKHNFSLSFWGGIVFIDQ